jgi:hypothetical protein
MSIVTYRDCARQSAFFLGLDDAGAALEQDAPAPSARVQGEINTLVSCVYAALHEIACDYVPLEKTEAVQADGGRIYFRDLSENILDIRDIKRNGKNVVFRRFHDCADVGESGEFEITYSFEPLKGGLETSLAWDGHRVGPRVAAYGAACEYCLLHAMHDDAALWDKRFKDALFKASSPKFPLKLKGRRWL